MWCSARWLQSAARIASRPVPPSDMDPTIDEAPIDAGVELDASTPEPVMHAAQVPEPSADAAIDEVDAGPLQLSCAADESCEQLACIAGAWPWRATARTSATSIAPRTPAARSAAWAPTTVSRAAAEQAVARSTAATPTTATTSSAKGTHSASCSAVPTPTARSTSAASLSAAPATSSSATAPVARQRTARSAVARVGASARWWLFTKRAFRHGKTRSLRLLS